MGTKLNRAHSLDSVITWWTNLAFGTLEPAEREVVCGDLAEAGEYGWRALRQVLSLVIRRRVLNLKSGPVAAHCAAGDCNGSVSVAYGDAYRGRKRDLFVDVDQQFGLDNHLRTPASGN